MTPARIVALSALALVAGCSKPPRPKATPNAQTPDQSQVAPTLAIPAAQATPVGDPPAGAKAFAQTFLDAVNDGTATPAMLTPEFKKVVAEPVFPDDLSKGYSDDAAAEWLARWKGQMPGAVFRLAGSNDSGEPTLVTGSGIRERKYEFTLRLVRTGSEWRADWFLPAAGIAQVGQSLLPSRNDGCFTAVAFLEALLGKGDRLAEGLMTPIYKARLAPPFATDPRGYNRGLLDSKLAEHRGGFTGYTIAKVDSGIVTGELTGKDGKKPFTLKLTKGQRPWDWLVDEFKAE
jgi:hypothetical protein